MQQFPVYRNVSQDQLAQALGKAKSQNLELAGYDLIGIANSCCRDENLRFLYHFFRLANEYASKIENHEPEDPNYARCCQFCRAAGVIAQQAQPITHTTFETAPREYMGPATKKEIAAFIKNNYTTTERLENLQG